MRRVILTAVGLLALGVLAVGVAGAAVADARTCTGQTLSGQIDGDVNAGPGCVLSGANVSGRVRVVPGGSLEIPDGAAVTISKDLQVEKGGSLTIGVSSSTAIGHDLRSNDAASIDIQSGAVAGNVRLEGTRGETFLGHGTVLGDVEIHRSTAYVQIQDEEIGVAGGKAGGDVKVHDNSGYSTDGGLISVVESRIHGNVDVSKNSLTGPFNVVEVSNGPADQPNQISGSVEGDLHVRDNSLKGDANSVSTHSNQVGGNLDVSDNKTPKDSFSIVDVSGNDVTKEIDCHGNRPRATDDVDFGNQAAKLKGECKSLV